MPWLTVSRDLQTAGQACSRSHWSPAKEEDQGRHTDVAGLVVALRHVKGLLERVGHKTRSSRFLKWTGRAFIIRASGHLTMLLL